VLSTVDPDFPMEAWDKLVPQAEMTLNLLRASRVNPAQSAWAALLHGPYDFLRHPMAPAGTKVLVFETSADRATWDPHGVPGFYVGPAMAHYRCYDCYVPRTKRMRTIDTVSWHPADVIMPGSSVVELLTAAIQDLSGALTALRSTPRELASGQSLRSAPRTPVDLCTTYRGDDTHTYRVGPVGTRSPTRVSAARHSPP
jgi:hypothetical protein